MGQPSDEKTSRRYLTLPDTLWKQIDHLAAKDDRSWYDMARVLIKAGLLTRTPNAESGAIAEGAQGDVFKTGRPGGVKRA
jgi:hypothetical protein